MLPKYFDEYFVGGIDLHKYLRLAINSKAQFFF